jgi:hypothetical protein
VGVDKHPAGRGQVECEEDGGPVDTVEAEDVLADDVEIGRPKLERVVVWVAGAGEIVDQGVDPDVDDLGRILGHGNAPCQALNGARNGQVLEVVLDPMQDLVPVPRWPNPRGVLFVELYQAIPQGRQTEAVVLFLDPFHLAVGVLGDQGNDAGERLLMPDDLRLRVEALIADAVPALVLGHIYEALVAQLAPDVLDGLDVVGIGGADEAGVVDIGEVGELLELLSGFVTEVFGVLLCQGGGLLDLQAMFIGAGGEDGGSAAQHVVALEDIGQQHRVEVANVGCCRGGRVR